MNTIKNIHYLDLSENDLSNLDKSAGLYASNSNITFKIVKYDDQVLVVEVRQDKNAKDKYLEAKELAKRANDLFGHFYPDLDIKVGTKPYKPPVVDVVDPDWIESNMSRKGMRLKDIRDITGISSPALSRWITGSDPMSQPVKSMFYFMLGA